MNLPLFNAYMAKLRSQLCRSKAEWTKVRNKRKNRTFTLRYLAVCA